jgi:hypothetical protein
MAEQLNQAPSELIKEPPGTEAPRPADDLFTRLEQGQTSEDVFGVQTEATKRLFETEREIAQKEQPFLQEALTSMKDRLRPAEDFVPTRENVGDLTALFGLLAVTTFMSGGNGKYSGMASLNNLSGAMDGYRRGKKDLFAQELKNWEKNFQVTKDWNDRQYADYKMALDTYIKNPALGMAMFKEAGAKEPDGLVNALINRGEIRKVVETAAQRVKQLGQAEQRLNEIEMKALLKGKAEPKGARVTAEVDKGLREAEFGLTMFNQIEAKLADPKVAKALDNSRFLRSLLETPKELTPVERYVRTTFYQQLPKEAQELVTLLASVRNSYYRQISGQAVTGGEAARNFFAVIQPSDNTGEIANKIRVSKPRYADTLLSAVDDYDLTPERAERYRQLAAQAGGGSQPTAAPSAGAPRTPTREEFIKAAKPLNPTLTDAQIGAEYDKKYGAKK